MRRTAVGRTLGRAMIDARGRRAVIAVTLARLPPQVPFAMGNVLAASAGVRVAPFLAGTALGMLPRVSLVVAIGAGLSELEAGATGGGAAWLLTTVGGVVGLAVLGLWAMRILKASPTHDVDDAPEDVRSASTPAR
jgi:uncharacterized membrane protein YdjX (TVP38/TMEM64 family)